MKPTRSTLLVLFLGLVGWSSLAGAIDPPTLVNYQGVLRNAQGVPLDGNFDMVFRFFNASTAGDEILVDEHLAAGTGAVTVVGGLFNSQLGSGDVSDGSGAGNFTSLDEVFRDNDTVFLEIQVDGETLAPRTRVVSSAYALNASNLDGAGSSFYLERSNHSGTQLPSSISPQGAGSGLDADTLDTLDAGNDPWQIPINNGQLNANLHSDLLDGLHANEIIDAQGGQLTCVENWLFFGVNAGVACPQQQGSSFTCPGTSVPLGIRGQCNYPAAIGGGVNPVGMTSTGMVNPGYTGNSVCWDDLSPLCGANDDKQVVVTCCQ